MRKSSHLAWASLSIAFASFAIACQEDVGSGAIRTRGMYAKYEALATGNGKTGLTAELRVGGDDGTFVVLEPGDELIASADGDGDKEMASQNDGKQYTASFSTDEEGTEFNIAFERAEDDPAPDSRVALPAPFTLSLEEDEAKVQRGNSVSISWDEGSGEVEWSVEGDCIWSRDGTTDDDGDFEIPADEIEVTGTDEGETCEVTITLERVNRGEVDPAFEEGGEFRAIQRRTVRFESTPSEEEGGTPADGDTGTGGTDGMGGQGGSN